MSWTVVSGTSWTAASYNTIPSWPVVGAVSVETRLNHLYPQMESAGEVPFIWQISSFDPWYVASGCGVYIRSSITEPLY